MYRYYLDLSRYLCRYLVEAEPAPVEEQLHLAAAEARVRGGHAVTLLARVPECRGAGDLACRYA